MTEHALRNDFDFIAENSLGILVDVQERFLSAIDDFADNGPALRAAQKLLAGAAALDVPWLISEQVPEKLGPTIASLRSLIPQASVHAKTTFSLFDDATLCATIAEHNRDTLIFCGLETHVCVLASIDDALRRGYRVVVAADAVASRQAAHREDAIATMRQLGATVVPTESILFRLCRDTVHPDFRTISNLVR